MLQALLNFLKKSENATIDLGIVLTIGIAFVGMTVIGFIIWTIRGSLTDTITNSAVHGTNYSFVNATLENITRGFDNTIGLILVAITIFVLALAISALLLLRQR